MDIKEFLLDFTNVLFDEHKKILEDCQSILEPYKRMMKSNSKHGHHYISCPWSKDDAICGPDTCECHNVQSKKRQAEEIMLKYHRLRNRFYEIYADDEKGSLQPGCKGACLSCVGLRI